MQQYSSDKKGSDILGRVDMWHEESIDEEAVPIEICGAAKRDPTAALNTEARYGVAGNKIIIPLAIRVVQRPFDCGKLSDPIRFKPQTFRRFSNLCPVDDCVDFDLEAAVFHFLIFTRLLREEIRPKSHRTKPQLLI